MTDRQSRYAEERAVATKQLPGRGVAPHQAHNLKSVGSSPTPATPFPAASRLKTPLSAAK